MVRLDAGEVLVAATDTLNEGVHFSPGAAPDGLGHKLLAVNLSDLAAMGAVPRWALMNLTLPEADEGWIDAFAAGFAALAGRYGVRLIGGDTCAGPRAFSLTLLGTHAPGSALRRSTARRGDRVFVSGTLGDAALALHRRLAGDEALPPGLAAALDRPEPRVDLGAALCGIATACIDLSDGLLADLGHLARASGLGATLELDRFPHSQHLAAEPPGLRWDLALCGGEDYELCFCVPPERVDDVAELGERLGLGLTAIGVMTDNPGVRCLDPDGTEYLPAKRPWEHFGSGVGGNG